MSSREIALIEVYALAQGISLDDAATDLMRLGLAAKYRRINHRPPATIHRLPPLPRMQGQVSVRCASVSDGNIGSPPALGSPCIPPARAIRTSLGMHTVTTQVTDSE